MNFIAKCVLGMQFLKSPFLLFTVIFGVFLLILIVCQHYYLNFSVIGISETRLLVGRDQITNTSIPGYTFFSQPSVQEAGGVGLYIRDDLCISTGDYECIWIENLEI